MIVVTARQVHDRQRFETPLTCRDRRRPDERMIDFERGLVGRWVDPDAA
jgi:hypothetical protein